VTPGIVSEGTRAIWQVGQVRVLDSGADANLVTADNSPFAVPGVYVP
jgi:hypothetical protein